MRVGIIGGGACGLAAAHELVEHGHEVDVYERDPFLGGHASTFEVEGARLERGYHHLFTSDTDILDLMAEMGIADRMRWIDSKVGTLCDGKVYSFATPADLLRFTPLRLVDRVRLGLAMLYLQRKRNWRSLEGITASEWLRRYTGERTYEVFWRPMLRGKFGEEYYDQIGMAWVWGKVNTRVASRGRGMTREQLGYPTGSFGEIFDAVGQRIERRGGRVHTSASVSRVVVEDRRAVGLDVALVGESNSERFDAVIATTPSTIFPRLVPSLPRDYLDKLEAARYMAAVLVILVLDRPLSGVYWLNIVDRSIPFVAMIEHTNFIEPEHYGGKHVVYLSNYLDTGHPLYRMNHEELLEEYVPHLRKINPSFDPSWIETSYHHRINEAQPIMGVNYSSRLPEHRTPFEGLYLANTTQIYPQDRGTNYSVRMGRRVARLVLEDLAGFAGRSTG